MSLLLQQIVAGLLVAGCALFSAWRLASVRQRQRLLEALAVVPGVGRAAWLARLRERMRLQAGGCGGCGQTASRARQGGASRNQTPGALRR
jgi:hypothetical protein